MQQRILRLVESKPFVISIFILICINALTIGMQTMQAFHSLQGVLAIFDRFCLVVYAVEAVLKLIAYRASYFKNGWNIFDFVIVVVSSIPTSILPIPTQVARVVRIFRIFRTMRVISAFKPMRVVVEGLLKSLPGVAWTGVLMLVVFYIFAVIGTVMFGTAFPEFFGTLGKSFYTLFQVMTLESWSAGIARPVIAVYPLAWIYFVPYVIISAYILINIVLGIVVTAVDESRARMLEEENKVFSFAEAISRPSVFDEPSKSAKKDEDSSNSLVSSSEAGESGASAATSGAKEHGGEQAPESFDAQIAAEMALVREHLANVERLMEQKRQA